MNTLVRLIVSVFLLVVAGSGCVDRTKNERVLRSIERLEVVSSSGLTFRRMGGGYSGGTAAKLARLEMIGELVATNGSLLHPKLANTIASNVRAELVKEGCVITGGGQGGGIHYTAASEVSNANIQKASVNYSLNGAVGRVDVLVIERDYESYSNNKVVGQLILTVVESR